ncbi:MAG: mannose-1-phosphate guanylyltransferase/mannose-6-phosphate isomerase [Deltaproteobacteria bacterium]|nr:mannose-1-phosphate guanylyltransferase/mannose-6-phosphate isomerase [Deltaproteobacteria bacterium]
MTLYPVILAGGSGTRLWPMSREFYPKPMLPLLGENTLLQETVRRLDGIQGIAGPLFVCNEEHRFLVAEQVRKSGREPACILLEPKGRNTAPALTLAALFLLEQDPEAMMAIMPADHVIAGRKKFCDTVRQGLPLAEKGELVTFGVVPERPETGYGYIRKGKPVKGTTASKVGEFVEKPDLQKAEEYLAAGEYLWNSGIFLMKASRWIAELKQYRPDIEKMCRKASARSHQDGDFYRVDKEAFLSCPSDSIDYAVMEKTDRAAVLPLDAGWSDVGDWSSLYEIAEKDEQGNVLRGDVVALDTRDSLLMSQSRFLATVGLEKMVVIETADAVLVADKKKAQDVKQVVKWLKENKREEYRIHRKVYRPWGAYEGVDAGERFQVKRLSVKPGAQLSLQKHYHRAEHWIVVRGTARITVGEKVFVLTENQSTYIPLGEMHRLENPGTIPLEIIEVQSGSYLGEDDIERFADVYDRCD